MQVSYILKKQPYLKICNINNVSTRLLERTNGTCFIVYNKLYGRYELHSTLSYGDACNSCNAVIEKSWLNWRIIEDFLANNHKRFGLELQSEREYLDNYYARDKIKNQFKQTSGQLDVIKRTLGRML